MDKEATLIAQAKKLSLDLYEIFNQLNEEREIEKDTTKHSVVIAANNYSPTETTLKIDTRLIDQINALSLIGCGNTQKETVALLIQNVLDSMTEDERRKFNVQYQVLEDKTIKQAKKSKAK